MADFYLRVNGRRMLPLLDFKDIEAAHDVAVQCYPDAKLIEIEAVDTHERREIRA